MLFNLARASTARHVLIITKISPITSSLQPSRQIKLVATAVKPPSKQSYDERNMKLGRPVSPHLSIIETQITWVLSITHRITGMMLSTGFLMGGIAAATCPLTGMQYVECLQSLALSSPTMFGLKCLITFPLAYHTCNGIRHLLWDTGRYLTLSSVYKTGYIMLAGTVILTFGLAAIGQ